MKNLASVNVEAFATDYTQYHVSMDNSQRCVMLKLVENKLRDLNRLKITVSRVQEAMLLIGIRDQLLNTRGK